MSDYHRRHQTSRDREKRVKEEKRSRSPSDRRKHYKSERHDSRERHKPARKDRRRSRSKSILSTSSSSYDESKFDKILDKKRLEKMRREKEEKRRLKELETPEEKRARRIAKKLQKEERRKSEALNAFPEGIPYTDLNNPFNDTNLTDTFVWKKKWETEGKADISRKKVEKINRDTIAKNYAEMEQLKRNREAREAAKEDLEMIERDQQRRQCDWNRTEDVFHLKQARLRSSIRIKEGRAKPIDYLARYITYLDGTNEEEFELDNPLNYFPANSIDDFEDLVADIKVYRIIDGQKNKNFWDDIDTIAKSGLKKLVENRRRSSDSTVHSSVQDEIVKIFKGKSYDELIQLEGQILAKIKNASRGATDVSYWESLLDQLRPFMARQRLKELHAKMLQLRLKKIREEQLTEMGVVEADGEATKPKEDQPTTSTADEKEDGMDYEMKEELLIKEEIEPKAAAIFIQPELPMGRSRIPLPVSVEEMLAMEDEQKEQCYLQLETRNLMEQFTSTCYEQGGYSPSYGNESHTMPGIEILDEAEDRRKLMEVRRKNRQGAGAKLSAKDQEMMDVAKKGMSNDEAVFAVEEELEKQHFLWSDKYRPRKPRYFNRVHTGFDWNKYNQTHYDIDNPPPKIVQGYRFNIFYPDLLDPAIAPKFTLTQCEDPDFAIIRFRAGPPYEDIAFKIVNREWEVSYKHGYKCQFQGGVFQLWFFFKRYRYRR